METDYMEKKQCKTIKMMLREIGVILRDYQWLNLTWKIQQFLKCSCWCWWHISKYVTELLSTSYFFIYRYIDTFIDSSLKLTSQHSIWTLCFFGWPWCWYCRYKVRLSSCSHGCWHNPFTARLLKTPQNIVVK